ncbi:hypothetical protein RJ639_028866 [Escallonia herrerae]|uniref:Uncharacterized protein n=1 Tax=Escallonia herrerae TaxID=1293975 RepID=A0AA89BEE9_9ASTE|nr:hypothetical protein RJ639_028866 [Escallonia herrerae]
MKSSLGKLRNFGLHKSDAKEKSDHQTAAHLDELAQASQGHFEINEYGVSFTIRTLCVDRQGWPFRRGSGPGSGSRRGRFCGDDCNGRGLRTMMMVKDLECYNDDGEGFGVMKVGLRRWFRRNKDGEGFGVKKVGYRNGNDCGGVNGGYCGNFITVVAVVGYDDVECVGYWDMHDMRNCYDSLLSAAAATANSAYEFSESLQEMGTCLMEKTALNDDGETGTVLLLLGKLQLELQKLVDSYRSHIVLTITNPSESLLSELRKVEFRAIIAWVKAGTSLSDVNSDWLHT